MTNELIPKPLSDSTAPAIRWAAVIASAVLLVAHKPWALLHAQLRAEDGTIFLVQNDQLGARAFFEPYQGYLHLLPRLIVWSASRLVDVAAWPWFYNSATLLIAVLLFVRVTSARIELPGKPWLVLAFGLVVQTGEVLLNPTNVQWIAAFFLVVQLFAARPTTAAQRSGDLAIAVVIGLTGPFSLLLLPLFAWRWWRQSHRDSLVLLLVVAGCAVVQAWFILRTGGSAAPAPPLQYPVMFAAVPGSRLVVWPLLGPRIAAALPPTALAAIGGIIFAAIALWSLRPDPRRELRATVLVVLLVITAAGAWRSRVDTWLCSDLANGDRYFFIPRVLLMWLLIWECDARPRVVAWIARVLCFAAVLLELPQHRESAPPDYHWADHCDAIRRGVPAKIPTLPEGWVLDYPGRTPPR